MKHNLSSDENKFINLLIKNIDEKSKETLEKDIINSTVNLDKTPSGWIYSFEIRNYERPTYKGQHHYNTEGSMLDIDGKNINVYIYADENDRLLEIELIRGEDGGEIISPLFNTLKILY